MAQDKTEVKKEQPSFELAEVATQTQVVIKNNETGEVMTEAQALVHILNELHTMKKLVA